MAVSETNVQTMNVISSDALGIDVEESLMIVCHRQLIERESNKD